MNFPRQRDPARILVLACAFEGGLLLVAYAIGWLVGVDPLATVTRDSFAVFVGLAAVVPILVSLWWGLNYPHGAVGRVTTQARNFAVEFLGGIGLVGFALISLVAGVGEEALFRGVLQTAIARYSNEWVGLIIASVLFGLAHAVSRAYAFVAAVIGGYLGWLYLYTGNLLTPIVCHAVYDFVALVLLVRSRPAAS